MRLVSWNVNGLRACMQKGFQGFLEQSGADIFCIQETKMHPEQANFAFEGYHAFWNSALKKGYSGVLTLSKEEPLSVDYGIGVAEHDLEGRVVVCEYPKFYLVNVYVPNAQRGLVRLPYRLEWERVFREFLSGLMAKKAVLLCGDLNVAHTEIDLTNPQANRYNAGFSDPERQAFSALLQVGFIDTYRYFYPEQREVYTWWSYMSQARERNIGWRIDYFLASCSLQDTLKNAHIYAHILGSDHCPVGLELHA
ncbi:Exodeoxyribonuclease III [Helicobacter sp. NHP19-003]|uniref:Exodeoxyribonuclease III n=1 Tax=Helicobacter gastrocanis TaxID=2849641 RepID=A0ABM7SC70_9HELI|nr:exodeoxyribonuclease III [Helicobacter sp. NHP19-003]BCZ18273.1 Exodeoxyribonuclease III [Helicobacter sp. NHP19-003]